MLRGRPRLVRVVPRRLSHNARHYGTSSVVIPAISPRRGRAQAAPFFRLALQRSGCWRRLAPSHAAPGAPNPTPPIPPTPGARGALSASPPRAAALPSSGRRTAPDRTGDKASKSQNRAEAQKTSAPRAHSTPPLTPPRGARGGRSASPPWCKTFPWRGGGGKRSHGPRRGGKGKPCGRGGSAPVPHAAPLPSSLAAQRQKTPPLSAQKNVGGAQGTAPQMKPI